MIDKYIIVIDQIEAKARAAIIGSASKEIARQTARHYIQQFEVVKLFLENDNAITYDESVLIEHQMDITKRIINGTKILFCDKYDKMKGGISSAF